MQTHLIFWGKKFMCEEIVKNIFRKNNMKVNIIEAIDCWCQILRAFDRAFINIFIILLTIYDGYGYGFILFLFFFCLENIYNINECECNWEKLYDVPARYVKSASIRGGKMVWVLAEVISKCNIRIVCFIFHFDVPFYTCKMCMCVCVHGFYFQYTINISTGYRASEWKHWINFVVVYLSCLLFCRL